MSAANVTPLEPQVDIPPDVRQQTDALAARMRRISSILTRPSARPALRQQAKDELAALAKDSLNLWSLI